MGKKEEYITMRKLLGFLFAAMLLGLCACAGTSDSSAQTDDSGDNDTQVQYDYQLKAGELTEVYDLTFEKMVTVTIDPASTRNGSNDLRSEIYFENCVFDGGLTIVGDYHAMVSLGGGCSFGDRSVITCKEATPGAAKEITLEDNLIKVFVACEGATVETECAMGVLSDGPDVVLNGTTYRKSELAPDAAFLGVYSVYEGGEMTYVKLAIGEDDSAEFLD